MAKTILEIAEELDVSKQAIRYQMNKIDDKYLNKRHDGAILISEAGEMVIRENMGREPEKDSKEGSKEDSKYQQIGYERLLDMLEKELDRKNEDIKNLNARLKEQQRLLDQQQQLNLHHISQFQLEDSNNNQDVDTEKNQVNDEEEIIEVNESKQTKHKKGFLKTVRDFFSR